MNRLTIILIAAAVLTGCSRQQDKQQKGQPAENQQAKAMLQGVWVDQDDGEVSIRVQGDTIFYADTTSMPAAFRIIGDSLVLASGARYAIVRQTENLFWFNNQNGDLVKLGKSADPADASEFTCDTPKVLTYTHQVKTDSVVVFNGHRYHWYIAINPTKYKVTKRSYNDDGMEVENVYYDNIMHVSVYEGAKRLYSSDFRKQMYSRLVPESFLSEAILTNMEYTRADAKGLHFNATLCIPDGVSSYLVESLVTFDGQMSMKLVD